ncbi:N-6 DNA methylase [Alsobacter sp. KACC 23698]|uniref:site-specific DNA-methyltransferase (adenine-specific) n=1 Tax=Alsobacter sp. KACC 23698 TaxID=3149229 RepID=A0AAU7JJ64_9HYPH
MRIRGGTTFTSAPLLQADIPEFCQKRSGAFFTPEDVARALVAWVDPSEPDRLLDPSCGDGQFLALHRRCVGVEQNPRSAAAAVTAAPWALVHEGDFFDWAARTSERFECAAGNPPFIRYQTFKGEKRRRALELCARQGVAFSGLTSSWAPFLVATASLLKPGGRFAFVTPAAIGHAPYAAPLLEHLVATFAAVHVVAIREKLFPFLSEDCWLLFAGGRGGTATHIDLTVVERFAPDPQRPEPTVKIALDEWRAVWGRRLRPYLLPRDVRQLYAAAAWEEDSRRLGDFASVGTGYLSGDNDFFHLRPSTAQRLGIPSAFLHPSLRSGKGIRNGAITKATVAGWTQNDEQVFLLKLGRNARLPAPVKAYLDSAAGQIARVSYKCKNREPWHVVPNVRIPEFMMSYMSGRSVKLIRNEAGVTCSNSVHALRVDDPVTARKLLPLWASPFVRLSCELEGHALGGGVLKLEPREAAQVLFPSAKASKKMSADGLEEAIGVLQRWRHYGERTN